MSELYDRCHAAPAAVRRPHAFVCVDCQEELVRSCSGFLLMGALGDQRREEYLFASLEAEMLDQQMSKP